MKPYPRNNLDYDIITPEYKENAPEVRYRYSVYRQITNLPFAALEVKLTNSISRNETYRGYYYTTKERETLYEIAKSYYNDEIYWWVIAKANNLKGDGSLIVERNTTLSIPAFLELTNNGGYFSSSV